MYCILFYINIKPYWDSRVYVLLCSGHYLDFKALVFFIKSIHHGPDSYPKFFSNLVSNLQSCLNLKFDSPLHHTAERFDSPLHNAAERFVSPLHMQWGVKL